MYLHLGIRKKRWKPPVSCIYNCCVPPTDWRSPPSGVSQHKTAAMNINTETINIVKSHAWSIKKTCTKGCMWYHIPCTLIQGAGHLEATQPIDPEFRCYVMLCYVMLCYVKVDVFNILMLNALRPWQKCHDFLDDIFKCRQENGWISIKMPLKFVP